MVDKEIVNNKACENAFTKKRRENIFVLGVLVVAFIILFLWGFFSVFILSGIQGGSMEPTFFENERLMEVKVGDEYSFRRGDVVSFTTDKVHLDIENGELLKRVVGLPGDLVEISDHQVYINGEPLSEPYAIWGYPTDSISTGLQPNGYL